MLELLRTNDIVAIGLIRSLLEQADLVHFIADSHVSAIEGGIGAFPQRVMVAADDLAAARQLMADAGLATYLPAAPV